VVPCLDAVAVGARRGDRESELDLSALDIVEELEAGVGEHGQSARVRGEDGGDESGDPVGASGVGELLEEPRADPAPLLAVGDGKGHLGGIRAGKPRVARHGDDAIVAGHVQPGRESATLDPVGIEQAVGEAPVDGSKAVEAQEAALVRQGREEGEQGCLVC
jgi:hypothetical protein